MLLESAFDEVAIQSSVVTYALDLTSNILLHSQPPFNLMRTSFT
jgi:hypothetical protein